MAIINNLLDGSINNSPFIFGFAGSYVINDDARRQYPKWGC
ncbi:hypothetical protein [Nostoc sp. GT001]|nr:hypothetical protein [Nostoc sp. GT001]MDM9581305.1 hypothetical protein [Nostoc sp. GT001]